MAIGKNPVLPGFYPDPSICRVGDTYYLVNSTFAYFPGVPVSESKDLIHWEQIGSVLERNSQVPLYHSGISGGIFAPTIRYHEGVFYMITTNVSGGGNFVVTANDPRGPWSEPHFLKGAVGIDPSLFFDDDGKCYYIGTRDNPDGAKYYGDNAIYVWELDLNKWEFVGDYHIVWHSALKNAVWPEGPHLYKRGDWYYVMIAEGGTSLEHAVTIARSKDLLGYYEGCKRNPILTHRHLGNDFPVQCVGHADLVNTPEDDWYLVCLATRANDGCTNLGRETFLAPVTWEEDWPVVNAGYGKLPEIVKTMEDRKNNGEIKDSDISCAVKQRYLFTECSQIPYPFLMLRNPDNQHVSLEEEGVVLQVKKEALSDKEHCSYLGLRQTSYQFTASTKFSFLPEKEGEFAGLAMLQNETHHLLAGVVKKEDGYYFDVCIKNGDQVSHVEQKTEKKPFYIICLQQRGQELTVFAGAGKDEGNLAGADECENVDTVVADGIDTHFLSVERAGGFVGTTIGMYASGNGNDSDIKAKYEWFEYQAE